MKTFTLYWLHNERDVIEGDTIADAMTRAGIGQGALRALDFWAHGDDHDYVWSDAEKRFVMTDEARAKLLGQAKGIPGWLSDGATS